MTTFMSHRNNQARDAGGFVRKARQNITPRKRTERQVERLVFAMVVGLTGMACWTAADTLPAIVTAQAAPEIVTAGNVTPSPAS